MRKKAEMFLLTWSHSFCHSLATAIGTDPPDSRRAEPDSTFSWNEAASLRMWNRIVPDPGPTVGRPGTTTSVHWRTLPAAFVLRKQAHKSPKHTASAMFEREPAPTLTHGCIHDFKDSPKGL